MRIYIIADSGRQPPFHLPWNYHLSVQAFIYDALETHEPALADDLHAQNHAPPFSFSEFLQTGPYDAGDDGLACESGFWVFNTDDARIVDAIANHARANELTVGHTTIPVEGVELKQIHGVTEARYRSISPIFISRRVDEKREPVFPDESAWTTELRRSVRGRLEARGQLPSNFRLDIGPVHWWEQKSRRVAEERWYKCARCEVTIRADRDTSLFIQEQGLGEASGMGMSCVMPTSHIPETTRPK